MFDVGCSVFDVCFSLPMKASTSAVLIRRVSMRFAGKRHGDSIDVLDNVSAEVADGEFVCPVRPGSNQHILRKYACDLDALGLLIALQQLP
jgi:hypothetical protein